jgi:hypothetical protein
MDTQKLNTLKDELAALASSLTAHRRYSPTGSVKEALTAATLLTCHMLELIDLLSSAEEETPDLQPLTLDPTQIPPGEMVDVAQEALSGIGKASGEWIADERLPEAHPDYAAFTVDASRGISPPERETVNIGGVEFQTYKAPKLEPDPVFIAMRRAYVGGWLRKVVDTSDVWSAYLEGWSVDPDALRGLLSLAEGKTA